MDKLKFKLKQYFKMFMQSMMLPVFYWIGTLRRVEDKLVIFADSHHNKVPYSMEDLYHWFKKTDYKVVCMTKDCDKSGYLSVVLYMIKFMLLYARAGYVFICDNFLPVASCKKRSKTQVIQMWHAGGMLKKYAYDTERDIPSYYRGNVFKNYSLIIVSDENCTPAYISGMKADPAIIQPLGLSRTDRFFSEVYRKKCIEKFNELCPEYKGKKIALWAPTFRGNAGMPQKISTSFLKKVQERLGDEWIIIKKLHPQLEKYWRLKSFRMPTEQLLPVAHVLISDYSSVIYDYVLMNKPLVLYVPDLDYYIEKNQFYIDYNELPGKIVRDEGLLGDAIIEEFNHFSTEQGTVSMERLQKFKEQYLRACDGHAMIRLINFLNL